MRILRKLWELLTPAQRRRALILLGLMAVGMLLEMLGIGLVIPALAVMTQTDVAASYPRVAPILAWLGHPTQDRLIVIGVLSLVGVFALKTLFMGFLTWWQMRFLYGFQADISQRLFEGYLRQPYTFHLQRNSAQLIGNAVTEVTTLQNNALLPAFHLIAEASVLVGVAALIVTIEPLGAVLLGVLLGAASFGFHRLTKPIIERSGLARQKHDGLRIQHLQQGLGGAKEVKLLGREAEFLAKYRENNLGSARAGQVQSTVSATPRLWLELAGIMGLAAVVLVSIGAGRPAALLLPTIGLFAAAAFRLMPSVNRALIAFQGLRYSTPVIDTLHAELHSLTATVEPPTGPALHFRDAIALTHVTFSYPSADRPALLDVSMAVPRGTSVGIIGGSGAGKSTLVDVLLGLLVPQQGSVEADGIDIRTNLRSWQDQIGYVPQTIFLTDDTLRRNVAFGLPDHQINEAAVRRAILAAQLERFVGELPDGLGTVVGERGVRLSGGQRQRIGIARALYMDPTVLVLDEATSSLDSSTEREVMDAVGALHGAKTIVIVAHRTSTVVHCDRLYRLAQGRVIEEGESASVLDTAAETTRGEMFGDCAQP